jgi:squalene-hopene/tetraprenyl-beta-curcumene cyclase
MHKLTLAATLLLFSFGAIHAQEKPADSAKARDTQIDKAWKFLQTVYDKPGTREKRMMDAGWGPKSGMIPYTALVLLGLRDSAAWDESNAMIKDSVAFITSNQDASGGFNLFPLEVVNSEKGKSMKGMNAVYVTSIVAQLLAELNASGTWKGKLNDQLAKARDYLKQAQVGNASGPAKDFKKESVGFGGWAYSKEELDKGKKPASNMSTSSYAIDAMKACGVAEDDPMWQDALTFLKRNQNAGEVQEKDFAASTGDGKKIKPAGPDSPDYGGAIYSEESSTGRTENEDGTVTLNSYGTMTYNMLRAYLYAGLKKDSLPVKLALGWVKRNYALDRVPGYREAKQYEQGLFYYYVSFSRALKALGEDSIEDDRSFKHDWRAELIAQLGKLQKEDGSWANTNPMWQEDSPILATAFALDALRHTRK